MANEKAHQASEEPPPIKDEVLEPRVDDRPRPKLNAAFCHGPFEEKASFNAIGGNLLTFTAYDRHGKSFKVMLDSGSSHDWADSAWAERQGGVTELPRPVPVEFANGDVGHATKGMTALGRIRDHRLTVRTLIMDLPNGYDVILGMPWLTKFNPDIDWLRSTIRVRDHRGTHLITADRDPRRLMAIAELGLISARAVGKLARSVRTFMANIFLVRPKEEDGKPDLPSDLPKDVPKAFEKVVHKHAKCFRSELPDQLPPKRVVEHVIETADARPVNLPAYPLSQSQLEEQTKQVLDMLDKGLIRTSSSPWGAPVLFVKKHDGQWRMCIDYRGLNAVTSKNTYPLPRIQECLDRIGNAKYITKLDLLSGFHQVLNSEESIWKTAFNTRMGKFEYLVMPMGLTNAPATFQTLMNTVLQPYLDRFVIVYLDDILVFSNSIDEHCDHLDQVLGTLSQNELFAKPTKCMIGVSEVEFCGHIVGGGVVRTSRSKTKLVEEWPIPTNVHEVRQFLGLASYYRRFVRNFATIAAPLSDLLKETDAELRKKKNRPIAWTARCQHAFEMLKDRLTSEPVLRQPDWHKPFVIETDASEWAIGCTLLQMDSDGVLHPVAFDGRKLQGAELNYAVQEKELLAIKHAIRTWSHYIDNHTRTKILTDHESLKYLKDTKVPSKRLAHWIAEFGTYDLDITYRPGTEATVPDAISRRPDFIGKGEAYQSQFNSIRSVDEADWEDAMVRYLRSKQEPTDKKLRQAVLNDKNHLPSSFVLEQGSLLYKVFDNGQRAPYLSPPVRRAYLERVHREYGHLGWPGLSGVLRTRAWWPSMEKDVQSQIRACPNCQSAKGPRLGTNRGPVNTLEREDIQLFEQWSIDLIGILPRTYSGNRHIITAIERSTGWPVVRALKDATSQSVMNFINEEIFAVYGTPNEILTDNGSNLVSDTMTTFLQRAGVRHRTTTPYHPQTNGKVERFNGMLGKMLTQYLYGKPVTIWDEYLHQALFAVRIRVHATSKCSPFFLLYGVHPRLPGDPNEGELSSDQDAKFEGIIARHAAANEARVAANRLLVEKAIKVGLVKDQLLTKDHDILVGTYVLIRDEAPLKFRPKWFGPYKVVLAAPIGTYALQDAHGKIVKSLIHGNRLLPLDPIAIDKATGQWNSAYNMDKIKKSYDLIDPSDDVREILKRESIPPYTYKELETLKQREWLDLQFQRLERFKLGEGKIGDAHIDVALFDKLRSRVEAKEKREKEEAERELVEEPPLRMAPLPPVTPPEQLRPTFGRDAEIRLQQPTATLPQMRTESSIDGSSMLPPARQDGVVQKDVSASMPAQDVGMPPSSTSRSRAPAKDQEKTSNETVLEAQMDNAMPATMVVAPLAKKRGRPKGGSQAPTSRESDPSIQREAKGRNRTSYGLRHAPVPSKNKDGTYRNSKR
jgi:hypothetical protein